MATTISTPKKRITARIPAEHEARLNEASSILGLSPNAFIVQAALKEARQVIANETEIRLSEELATKMIELLDSPPQPTPAALKAKKIHKELVQGE